MTTIQDPPKGLGAGRLGESAAPEPTARPEGYWAWVGAHGGAGVTTLAGAVPGGIDSGRLLPPEAGLEELPAVVVCRSNAKGLIAARTVAAKAAATETEVLGLVVVADMPERKRPRVLADLLYVTRGGFPVVWEMPWVSAWRLGDPPDPANNPPQVAELLRSLWSAVRLPLPGPNQRRTP